MIRREFALGLAGFLLIASVSGGVWVHRLHFDRLNRQPAILNSDMYYYFYPVSVFMHRELQAGRWPLWNPYQLAGVPFVSLHVPGVYYPLNRFIWRWLDPGRALEVHAVLHLIIAGFFTWLFASSLGLSPPARLAAGFAFMLTPAIWRDIYIVGYLSTSVWLPAVLWSVRGVVVEGRLRWAVALSAALSLAFLGGHAQGFLYQAQLAFVYGIFGLVIVTRHEIRARAIATFCLALVLTLGLTAVQMLPVLELINQGTRHLGGMSLFQAGMSAITLNSLIEEVLGGYSFLDPKVSNIYYSRITLSTLTIPLILLGLADRKNLSQWAFFLCILILSGLFMLGTQTFVFRAYYSLPLGNLFRTPLNISFLYTFSAAVLVGIGVQGAMTLARSRKRHSHAAGVVAGLLVVAVVGELYHGTRLTEVHPSLEPEDAMASRELVEGLRLRAPLGRVFVEVHPLMTWGPLLHKMGMMNGLYVVPDYEPILPGDYRKYFDVPEDPPWHANLSLHAPFGATSREEVVRLLDLMSVEYYLTGSWSHGYFRREIELLVGREFFQLGEALVARRNSALPRSYIVNHLIYEPDQEKALRLLRKQSFNPRDVAVVDSRLPGHDGGSSRTDGKVVVTSYEPETVILNASCRTTCFLILTDLYYPGWVAHVDGRETKIHRANFLFRGIRLEPGSHEVIYRYRPRSFLIGSFITVLASLLAAGVLIWDAPWRRDRMASAASTRPD